MVAGENIAREVKAALERDPRVDFHRHAIEVRVDPDGMLIVEGELPTIAAKKLALEHAAAVPGVNGIVDRLRVTPTRAMGDGEIRDHLRAALLEEPVLDRCTIRTFESGGWQPVRQAAAAPPCSIDVAINDGVVTLDGQVGNLSQKRLAGVLAWWVPGSRDVVNGLEVAPQQQDTEGEIAEAVKLVLDKDPLINGDRIRVRVRDAVVTLEGLVRNDAESEMAEMDAWYVFGVDRVVNRLERAT